MSLEALAVALTADLRAEASLTLIQLADISDEHHVAIPYLPMLARRVHADKARLRQILDELVEAGILSPVSDHPFDFPTYNLFWLFTFLRFAMSKATYGSFDVRRWRA